jgi:CRP-like cAMP-binding protein
LDEFESGVFIGEVKSMVDETSLTTTVKARRKCRYFSISKEDFLQFLSKNPGLFILFNDFKYIE